MIYLFVYFFNSIHGRSLQYKKQTNFKLEDFILNGEETETDEGTTVFIVVIMRS